MYLLYHVCMSLVITRGTVLVGDELTPGTDVTIEGGRIASVGPSARHAHGDRVIDAAGRYVLPGLVDMHSHGMRDVMVDKDDIFRYSRHQLENGVTACLPTLAGSPTANIARMRAILQETNDLRLTPNLVGFRPEIMYLADASGGPAASLALPTPETTLAVWEASGGRIRIWDVSPELDGALPFIQWCASSGVVASMAHSGAGIELVRRAVDAGLTLVTHFYDLFAMPRETDEGVYPAGVTDYINIEDRLSVEIIPDGVHVHPILVEKTLRCKGIDKVAFITDSLKGSGNPPGRYEGLIPGEPVEVTEDRGIRRISDGILSGSALTQIAGFRNAIRRFGRSIPAASRLCSRTPARVLGLSGKGAIGQGMDADLIVLDQELDLCAVVMGGEVALERP